MMMNEKRSIMSHNRSEAISVIMCVYKPDPEHLEAAISSILNQTFSDFEYIIVIDGPDDKVESHINSFDDNRIKVIINKENLGLTCSLNVGLKVAKGKYVARMDSDDIALFNRFEEQYKYMEKNSDVVVLGSFANVLGTKNRVKIRHIENQEILRIRMMFYNAGIIHPTAFI